MSEAASRAGALTPHQLHILRHSLGLDDHGQPYYGCENGSYRNYYISDPDDDLTALCEAGLMANYGSNAATGGANCYRVTDAGKALVAENAPPPIKRTRSQQTYQDFLATDCGWTFGEYLKYRHARSKGVQAHV